MKKTIILIMAILLTFSFLAACSGKEDPADSETDHIETESQEDKSVSEADISNISLITDFSNGLAFVQYNDDLNTYCIDKTGKQLFKLENVIINDFAKFNNTVAMIKADNGYILCDKKGKTYTAEDFDATRIVLDGYNHQLAFLDGYIILERKEESYTGTKTEMSIMDSDFHTLAPFSVELAKIINSTKMSANGTRYYDGYLYFPDDRGTGADILDLRTGKQLNDTTQMKVSKPLYSYWAEDTSYRCNFEYVEKGDIYNALTGEIVAKVQEKESVSQISFFGDIGLATYNSDNGTWFNVIEKNGKAKFEPIKIGYAEIKFDGEKILIIGKQQTEKDNLIIEGASLKTYDICGNLSGEIVLENKPYNGMSALTNLTFSDGVVKIYDMKTSEYLLYNSDLEKLF